MGKQIFLDKGKGRRSIASVFLILVALCAGFVIFVLSLENYLVLERPLDSADAIVVMAGAAWERLPSAASLYKQGRAPIIILTNDGVLGSWSPVLERNLYQIEWAEQKLIRAGVPARAIIKLPFTKSGTYFDAKNTLEYLSYSDIRSVLIVTSDYHTRRAYWTFLEISGAERIKFGTYSSYSTKLTGQGYYRTLKRSVYLVIEFVKLIYYQIKY